LHDIDKKCDSKSIIAENISAGGPHGISGIPHGIVGTSAGGPHGIDGVHCPEPGCKGVVQCRGGGGQYPAHGGGPHDIVDSPDAGPPVGDHVGGCPPLGDPPYGIIVDVWAL
jgi:hypothetical protein